MVPRQLRLYVRQSAALGRKNVLIRVRSWQLNLAHLISSVFVIFIIWAVDQAVKYSNSQFTGAGATPDPPATPVNSIPLCTDNIYLKRDVQCKTFIYTPAGNSLVEEIVDAVRQNNEPPLPPEQVMGMSSREEVDQYLMDNPQTVMGALHFRNLTDQAAPSLAYTLQTNDTAAFFKGEFQDPNTYLQLPLQVAVEREFGRHALNAPNLLWDVAIRNFPHPSLETESTIGRVAPVFIMAALMFNVVLLLQNVVGERETGVRGAMVSMGLLDSAYWTSVICMEILNSVAHAAILTLFCMAFQFDMALKNDPALLFILLLLSALALSSGSLVLSVLVRKADLAVPVSLVIFIIAWVFIMVLSFGFPYNGTTHTGIVAVFSLFPWSLLSKGLLDLANATTGTNEGLTWETRGEYCYIKPPPPEKQEKLRYWTSECILDLSEMYYILLGQAVGYLLMALYLDSIVPQEPGGTALPWYFLMMPSFWSSNKGYDPSHAKHALDKADQELQSKQGTMGTAAAVAGAAGMPVLPPPDVTPSNGQLKEEAGLTRDLPQVSAASIGQGGGAGARQHDGLGAEQLTEDGRQAGGLIVEQEDRDVLVSAAPAEVEAHEAAAPALAFPKSPLKDLHPACIGVEAAESEIAAPVTASGSWSNSSRLVPGVALRGALADGRMLGDGCKGAGFENVECSSGDGGARKGGEEGTTWAANRAEREEEEVPRVHSSCVPSEESVGILEDDPDVAAEAANARAICARFLAAHLHPSTSQQGGTPEWTPAFSDSDRPDLQHKANDTTEDSAAFSVAAAHMHSPPTGNASRTHSHTSYSSKSSTVERPNGPGAPSAPALLQAAGQGLPLVGYGGVASQGPGSMDSNRTVAGSSIVSSTRAGDKEGEDAGPNADAVPQPVNAQPDGVQVDGFGRDGCARRAAEGLSFVGGGEEKLGQMVDAKQPDQSSANLANVILSSSSISHKAGVQGNHSSSLGFSRTAVAAASTQAPHPRSTTSRSASSSKSSSNHSGIHSRDHGIHQAAGPGHLGAQHPQRGSPPLPSGQAAEAASSWPPTAVQGPGRIRLHAPATPRQASGQLSPASGSEQHPSVLPPHPALSHSTTGPPTSSHTSTSSSSQASPGAASSIPNHQQHIQHQQQSDAGTSVSSSTSMANSGGPTYTRTGSSSAGSLHVHVGADTHVGTGPVRTITDSTGGLSIAGRDVSTDASVAAPQARPNGLDHRQQPPEEQSWLPPGVKQACRDGAGVPDEATQDGMGTEGGGQQEQEKGLGSDPSQLLPPGVHLFGLQKMFLRSEWWMPQFWLAKHGSKDRGAEGGAPKASMLSWLDCLCWPPAAWRWLKRWWADLLEANTLVAVKGVWLSLSPGNCFCLLGPNGAGKTTIIKCLTGAAQASGGDALVWGHSVRGPSGLSAARAITGVCPQFDVLWPQLTGIEHLNLFSHIKGLSSEVAMAEEAASLLKQVGLTKAGDVRSGAYSGGMRRRLSLAIALLGDPALLVLDEPTTGLDPVSRRGVWNLLSDAKHGRVMLLTTHSMEEADVLGDRIGIIAAGMLRCLGSGLRLKTRFGDGIRVSVALATKGEGAAGMDARREVVRRVVQQQLEHPNLFLGHPKLAPQPTESNQTCYIGQPNCQQERADNKDCQEEEGFEDARSFFQAGSRARGSDGIQEEACGCSSSEGGFESGREQGSRSEETEHKDALGGSSYEHFLVPKEREDVLPELFLCLEELSASVGIVDIQVGLTPLEDVFLKVVSGLSASR